jgi:hypothetical protein
MIIGGGLLLGYAIPWLRRGESRLLGRTLLLVMGAALIGILSNAVNLFTSYDVSKESIRGGSELADEKSNYTQNGLSEHAAFDFSMYKLEPLVMFVPDIYGGSSDLQLPPEKSKATSIYQKMPRMLADQVGIEGPKYYWGGVGELFSGPPYVGAVIILLALIGFFILDNKHKWWILAVIALTIIMSWGSYFQGFNGFLLKYLPMYNKFRAPSMILVVPSFLLCLMATLTLQRLTIKEDRQWLWQRHLRGLLLVAGLFLLLAALYVRFDYTSPRDADLMAKAHAFGPTGMQMMSNYIAGLKADRQQIFGTSIIRTLAIAFIAASIITLYLRKKFAPALLLTLLGALTLTDLFNIDLKYLNNDNYKARDDYEQNFAGTHADSTILADRGYYRVFDIRDSVSNALTYGAMTAYFHQSIGGYHAARLKIYEDLMNRQLINYPNCDPVIDMLNTKYIIRAKHGGGDTIIENKNNLGPVWFVHKVLFQPTANGVMNDLTYFDPRQQAILFTADSTKVIPPDTSQARKDTSMISLVQNENDEISYLAQSNHNQFAVFSEVYYKRGWRAWVDAKEVPIIRTNYVLRGLSIPAGRHVIRFFFRPLSYYLGRQIQWMASIIFLLMVTGAIIVALREYPFPFRKVVSSSEKCEPLSSGYPMPRSPLKE